MESCVILKFGLSCALSRKYLTLAILSSKGLPASPGAGAGIIAFSSERAHQLNVEGQKVLLVRQETSPEDISGMVASQGILTARGGMTSHAAVVARGMGKPCVAGCSALSIDYAAGILTVNGKKYKEGDSLTIDGATGEVIEGVVPTIDAAITEDFAIFMKWSDEFRKLGVRTNADTPDDSKVAVKFGFCAQSVHRPSRLWRADGRRSAESLESPSRGDTARHSHRSCGGTRLTSIDRRVAVVDHNQPLNGILRVGARRVGECAWRY